MGPDPGVKVCLEFNAHAHAVGVGLGHLGHLAMGLAEGAKQVLHMVAHLMGDDIGIGEIPVGAELLPHRGEEAEVDVEFLVGRAVERTHGRLAGTAAGGSGAGVQYEGRIAVFADAVPLEIGSPHVFGGGEDLAGELGQGFVLSRGFIRSLFGHGSDSAGVLDILDHVADIAAHHEGNQGDEGDAAQSESGG